MRNQKAFGQINKNEVKMDFKPKMVKGRTGWLVKGLLYAVLLGGSTLATTSSIEASAAEWAPNTAEMIRANIKEGDNAYTFVQGDTFYEIGNAINVKYDVLMALNGFKEGSQYSIPVGTTISFDGNEVTITDKEGNVTNQQTLTDEAKINPSQPFMNQSSSGSGTTTKPVVTTPTNTNSGSTNNGGQSNNNGGQTNPTKPEVVNPINPVTPVDPKPVEPTTPEENNEIESLKAEIAAKKELLTSYEILLASNQENIDNYSQALSESQAALNTAIQNQAKAQENASALQAQSDGLSNELSELQGAADNIGSQIAEAEVNGEDTSALQDQLNEINAIIAVKTGEKAIVENQLNIANIELSNANTDLASQQAAVAENQQFLSELQAERENLQADITALEAELAELEAKLAELEGNVKPDPEIPVDPEVPGEGGEETDPEIPVDPEVPGEGGEETDPEIPVDPEVPGEGGEETDPEIPVDPEVPGEGGEETDPEIPVDPEVPGEGGEETPDPENPELSDAQTAAIAELEGLNLTTEQKSSYVAAINGATTVAEVNTQVELAKADSEINNAQDEDAKKLAEAKKEALQTLAGLNLKGEADSFNEQINNAKSIEEINAIIAAAEAISAQNDKDDAQVDADAKALAEAKAAATSELTGLNLKGNAGSYEARINNAKSVDEVNAIMAEARVESNANDIKDKEEEAAKELAQAKANAKIELSTLNLSPTEKSDFEARIDAAKDLATVNAVMVDARKQSDINNSKPEVKETAIVTVSVFNGLVLVKDIEVEVELDADGYWEIDPNDLDIAGYDYVSGNLSGYANPGDNKRTSIKVKVSEIDWSSSEVQAVIAQSMVDRINEERIAEGLDPLIWQTEFDYLTDIRAQESTIVFDHKRPDGSGYMNVFLDAGYNAHGYNGETLQYLSTKGLTPEQMGVVIAERYLNSSGHRAILMNPRAHYMTVGFYYDEETGLMHSAIIVTETPLRPSN